MKIKLIQIDNYKILKNFIADVQGKSFMLMGKNGVGKTSVEHFVQIVLGNIDILPPDIDINGYVITTESGEDWKFKIETHNGKVKVTAEGPDGMKITDDTKGKGKIAQIVGAMNFNPHKFFQLSSTEKGRKEQVEIWKNTFLDEDTRQGIARMEENVRTIEADRTVLGRDIKNAEGMINTHPLNAFAFANKLDDFKPVDITEITGKHAAAVSHNEKVERAIAKKAAIDESIVATDQAIATKQEELKKLLAEIEALSGKVAEAQASQKAAETWIADNPKQDTSDLDTQIKIATEANTKHTAALTLKEKIASVEKMKEDYGEATANIHSQRQAIQDAIMSMGHSIDGLVITENEMIYRDVPVHNSTLSASERIELAYKLKQAENPRIKFIFIEDSNLLDEEKWEAILELTRKYDMQIIGEEVVRGQKTLKIEFISNETK